MEFVSLAAAVETVAAVEPVAAVTVEAVAAEAVEAAVSLWTTSGACAPSSGRSGKSTLKHAARALNHADKNSNTLSRIYISSGYTKPFQYRIFTRWAFGATRTSSTTTMDRFHKKFHNINYNSHSVTTKRRTIF